MDPKIQICVVKTMLLIDKEENRQDAWSLLEAAANQGSAAAAFMLWENNYQHNVSKNFKKITYCFTLSNLVT